MDSVGEPQQKRAKTGGRKPGSLNKATRLRQQFLTEATLAAALMPEQVADLTPLEVMRAIMRNRFRAGDYDGALAAAREAAPYVHARLNATDVTVRHTAGDKSDAEIATEIEMLREKIDRATRSAVMAASRLIEATAAPIEPAAEHAGVPFIEPGL